MDHRLERLPLAFATLLIALLLGVGCVPAIGDECVTSSDCPGNAICDSTAPGGYCTIPHCEIGSCPGHSICVEFDRENAYCMRHCEDDSDCRDGYNCFHGSRSRAYCYAGS